MDFSRPLSGVFREPHASVLDALSRLADAVTGRQLAVRMGRPVSTVARTLTDLQRTGLVIGDVVGPSTRWRLNRSHILWGPLERMLAARVTFEEELHTWLASRRWPEISVAVFGSVARGDSDGSSDVDLVIVLPDPPPAERDQYVQDLEDWVRLTTGNRGQVIDVTRNDLHRMAHDHDPLIASLQKDARTVYGPALDEHIARHG